MKESNGAEITSWRLMGFCFGRNCSNGYTIQRLKVFIILLTLVSCSWNLICPLYLLIILFPFLFRFDFELINNYFLLI